MCGGSYMRVEAFWEAHRRLDVLLPELYGLWPHAVGRSDIVLAGIMMAGGYQLFPWVGVLADKCQPSYDPSNITAALVHGRKEFYRVPLSEGDGPVITDASLAEMMNGSRRRREMLRMRRRRRLDDEIVLEYDDDDDDEDDCPCNRSAQAVVRG
jgi:hypothetical protein